MTAGAGVLQAQMGWPGKASLGKQLGMSAQRGCEPV